MTTATTDSSPSRNQNGSLIAFESYRDDTDGVLTNREIYICDFNGRNILRLTKDDVSGVDKRGVQDFQTQNFARRSTIAWISERGRTTNPPKAANIWLMDITGENQRRLTSEISVSNFTWARDSKSLLFSSAQTAGQNGAFSLKRVSVADGAQQTLSTLGDFSDMQLSPDGTRLVSTSP